MSRETDSSPYPQDGGRGSGASYPSGTPAYGTGAPASPPDPQDGGPGDPPTEAFPSEEQKTETTVTTRVRINIPGSRPIPPVVVRKPVSSGQSEDDAEGDSTADDGDHAPEPRPRWEPPATGGRPLPPVPLAPGVGGEPGRGDADRTSDWFAPRRNGQPTMGGASRDPDSGGQHRLPRQTPPPASGQGLPPAPGHQPPAPGHQGAGQDPQSARTQQIPFFTSSAAPGDQDGGAPEAAAAHTSAPRDSRAGDPSPGGPGPNTAVRPGDPTPMGPTPGGLPQDGPGHRAPADGGPLPGDLPQGGPALGGFPGGRQDGSVSFSPEGLSHRGLQGTGGGPRPLEPNTFPGFRPPAGAPAGPTAGPVTGDMTLPRPGAAPPPQGDQAHGQPPAPDQGGVGVSPGRPGGPAPGGQPPVGYQPARGETSSDTLVGGVPVVSPERFPPGLSEPGDEEDYRYPGEDDEPPRSRSRLLLALAAVLVLVVASYAGGLLLDHADVPKGTTVLGVDIGGKSREEAIRTLNARLGRRVSQPIPVQIGTEKATIDPKVAGLDIDTADTVRGVAHRDYNPVSVIGSLFGGKRTAQADFHVDRDKLRAALRGLTDQHGGGLSQEGMVRFERGKAIGVPGKVGLAVDVDGSVDTMSQAYAERAASGANPPVELRRGRQEPKVTQEEINRAIREFGEPAMSGLVTIKAGTATISFSPERSLPKFLSMRATKEGRLEPYFDLKALEDLYGTFFDGVIVDHGGSKGPVTPRDVAATMLPLLKETDPAKRIGVMQVVQ